MTLAEHAVPALTLAALIGCGLVAGTFFAFSTFVMPALRRRPAAEALAAMQAVNVAVFNPLFMGTFLGTAGLSAAVAAVAVLRWTSPGSGWLLAGGTLYLLGTFGVTAAFNVPLNSRIAPLDPADERSAEAWTVYDRRWTAWNHARAVAATAATACLALALRA
ncbi:MAG TPA: anthrone oxygenase family protein [Humisphaera sp.]